jgi:site-specific DNA-methyltransferase (adenine-specific)
MNRLYFGDNLKMLRDHVADESVDLIYLDPPFNSNATYNVLFAEKSGEKSTAQITAFDDTWHWGLESETTFQEIVTGPHAKLAAFVEALRGFLGTNDMMAYLTMMAIRLVELRRVLKQTGSIYLHCDPTASHYLKMLMDAVFGGRYFRNEIAWCYRKWSVAAGQFTRNHDIVLFYSKSDARTFNNLFVPLSAGTIKRWKGKKQQAVFDDDGRRLATSESGDSQGSPTPDWWDISIINPNAAERLGYPTQKPEALLERIIAASSNEGDMVLDPFCGCGTTIAVAQRLNRCWIGIDITHLAIALMRNRLQTAFGAALSPYEVIGDPKDLEGAAALAAEDRFQFEWWALGLVDAWPAQDKKKGADTGIDGYISFFDDNSGKAKRIIVQVKSGHVGAAHVRDLKGTLEREKAAIAVLVTLEEPTKPMRTEALSAGFYDSEHFKGEYPRVQILTIRELLDGPKVRFPQMGMGATFKPAPRKGRGEQQKLF